MPFLGTRKKCNVGDEELLLPYNEDLTSLGRNVHQKMQVYQILRALNKGFMPSTEQLIVMIKLLLDSEFLSQETTSISESGQKLLSYLRQWMQQLIQLLGDKNNNNQIQNLIAYAKHARLSIDSEHLNEFAKNSRMRGDILAAYESIKTASSLLLTNSDFRIFLSDLNNISRQILSDTANTISFISDEASKEIDPLSGEGQISRPLDSDDDVAPTMKDLNNEIRIISTVTVDGLKKSVQGAKSSVNKHISQDNKQILIKRLKAVANRLRKRRDYSDSVNALSYLVQRYVKIYSQSLDETFGEFQNDIEANDALQNTLKELWSLLTLFGDKKAWDILESDIKKVMGHSQKDPNFENLCIEISRLAEDIFTNPEFFESIDKKLAELKTRYQEGGSDSHLFEDLNTLTSQIQRVFDSVMNDEDVSKLWHTTNSIFSTFCQPGNLSSKLPMDIYSIILPLLIQIIQYIPVPRLEISVQEIDLLLENIVFEPGNTINHSSFFPFRLKIQSLNELTLHKARFRLFSTATSLMSIKLQGLSLCTEEVGFWFHLHRGLFWFSDEGIASFALDGRGIDIELDIEIGKERLENILTLRDVRVKVHNLSYKIQKSRLMWLAWLLKPLLRPLFRRALEQKVSSAIKMFFHSCNRELLFARERWRATRISNPQDLRTFLRAILTRLKPRDDPDAYTNFGIRGAAGMKGNPFYGKYAPGSIVKLWDEEVTRADEVVHENAATRDWRNNIFDIKV
ncbi:BgTH12-02294 [Blumeria graminis f. sp. triticale]|uniref:BgTH12-02294 n=1 Tax=Blumeria graminis f. sp. triticale TaxID=1689686 RepID=A0A9W4D0U6_BLUGR|nr:BgTH12-02294 [Blumeria graminis f. sp. triticale]